MPGETMRPLSGRGRVSPVRPEIADIALRGLQAKPKTLPATLFYDAEGCRLFGEITRLPEYYVTRTELALLAEIAPELGAILPEHAALVEYGASDETKARLLLAALRHPATYVPIDVAASALDALEARLRRSMPNLAVFPIAADFLEPLPLPDGLGPRGLTTNGRGSTPIIGFFPGSTIGNFEPATARRFLLQVRATLGPKAQFLVGVDLRKDPSILIPAYDDKAGITAAFNRNMLVRLNREAAADFDPASFAHRAVWNDAESRIEMHLISLRNQVAHVVGHPVHFARGESIHTENSYKHTPESFAALARSSGWSAEAMWTDPQELFSIHLLGPTR
jgi:L-histidine Nalpha-methyltransferase